MSPQQRHEVKTTNTFVDVPLEDNLPLADVVDFHLEHNPDKTCYACAEPDGTVHEITYREFGRAVHRAAHALRPAQQGADGAVVAIIALSDTVLYHAITIGLMKAGLVVRRASILCHPLTDVRCSRSPSHLVSPPPR